jgi:hypothetical protein
MDLAKLRVDVRTERTKTAVLTVLVLHDGQERIALRAAGNRELVKTGAERLVAGALNLLVLLEAGASGQVDS